MRALVLYSALLLLAPLACAQFRSQIAGVAQDASGAVVPNVTLTLTNQETGIRRSARTNSEGSYAITSLPPGPYKLIARKEGFQTVARLGLQLGTAQQARVDVTMQVGSVQEVITIEGSPALINTEDGSVGVTVGRRLLDDLPLNGRGLLSVVDLAAGVVATPASGGEAGQFTVNGERPNANYFTVDGVGANNHVSSASLPGQFTGGALPTLTAFGSTHALASLEATQEVRIQTSSFAPEFGRLPGGQISLTTRSGSNGFHGSLYEYFRNHALSANDWFANRAGQPEPAWRSNDFGGVLGGPVVKNRTFFFASYEGLRLLQPDTRVLAVPSLSLRQSGPFLARRILGAYPLPNGPDLGAGLAQFTAMRVQPARSDAGGIRLDHALTSRLTLFARYQEAPSSNQFGSTQVDSLQVSSHTVTAGLTAVFSPTLVNELRVNASQAAVASQWFPEASGGARPVNFPQLLPSPAAPDPVAYGISIAGLDPILGGRAGRNRQGQWNFVDTLTLSQNAHQWRFGADYQRLTPSRGGPSAGIFGVYTRLSDLLADRSPLVLSTQAEQASSLIETLSLFAQDTWRAGERLTLTYGLRWELTPAPAVRQTSPALYEPFWPTRKTQLAPRFGLAWRLTSAGQTVLRVGAGVFYDLEFSAATDAINGAPFNSWPFSLNAAPPAIPVLPQPYVNYGFAPNLHLPYSLEWNVSVERPLTASDTLSIGYVGSAGHRLLRREGSLPAAASLPFSITATNGGSSRYHALEWQYRRRFSRGLQGNVAYTWAHSIDTNSWDSSVELIGPGFSPQQDRASSNFDVRHNLTAALSYNLPAFARRWAVDTILRARSGFPLDILSAENSFGLGFDNAIRPDLMPGAPLWIADPHAPGGARLNPAAFVLPASLRQGNLGRNVLTGFPLAQWDLALRRQFVLPNESVLQLRAEAFNALNHPSFGDPIRFLDSPLFGQSVSLQNVMLGSGSPRSGLTPIFQPGGARAVQLSLRWRF